MINSKSTGMNKQLLALHFLLLFSFSISSFAQSEQQPNAIFLKNKTLQTTPNAAFRIDSLNQALPSGIVMQAIVQFNKLPDAAEKALLQQAGFQLLDYVPTNSFICLLSLPLNHSADAVLLSILFMKPEWKIDSRLLPVNANSGSKSLFISFLKQASFFEIEQQLKSLGGTITDNHFASHNVYTVSLPNANLLSLAASPIVRYIGIPASDVPLNNDERAATSGALLQAEIADGGFGLDGSGITIGVGDNSAALFHVDTRDRVTNFNPDPPADHGTHVTTTAAGAGILDPKAKGMAPAANILSHLYNIVWAETETMFKTYNMTLTNNSYAAIVNDCGFAGTYDQYAQILDENAFLFPEVENVFAAGNDGNNLCTPYPQGFGTLVGSYQAAKNVIDVASVKKDLMEHTGSSKGPVKDGRLKPDIASFGHSVYSAFLFNNYQNWNGTSMATPGITGGLALLSQRYQQLFGANPDGSLLKTLVLNGANDLGNPGPDFIYGFGLMNLYHSIQMLNNHQYLVDSIANGNTKTHSIVIPPNTAAVKVLLYWNDPAASPMSSIALVNDLDLKVVAPNASQHLPLVLDATPANVNNPATEGADHLNNAEQVVIQNPVAGSYDVKISGFAIPSGKQVYTVAYDFIPVGIRINFPVQGASIKANDSVKVYWEASENNNPFTLEYSINNGANWIIINAAISSAQRYFTSQIPALNAAQCLMRLSRNGTLQSFTTGAFSLSEQPDLQLSANQCPGYIAVEWNAISNATSYEILRKKGAEMVAVDTTASLIYTFSGLSSDTTYFIAVRPLINDASGYRSIAVSRQPNDGNCAGAISDNDLRLEEISAPNSGRKFTSTQLATQPLLVGVRNLDDAGQANFTIHYRINNGAWLDEIIPVPVSAGSIISFAVGNIDFSAAGDYFIQAVVENTSAPDPVPQNDTLTKFIRHLTNNPIDLNTGYTEDFETTPPFTLYQNRFGITPDEHWDYAHDNDSARIRSLVASNVTISGNRSLSMDLLYNLPPIQNYLSGTFNLQNYDTATTEARFQFDYKIHGKPKSLAGNEVWIRGNDQQPWTSIFTFDTSAIPGDVVHSNSLSLTNFLLNAGQQFSSSFQIRIGQRDTSCIAANEYGNGITLDNFRLYSVKNDVQLLSINNPKPASCALSNAEQVSITIYNSDNLPQQNVQLFYRFDGQQIISATIPFLAPKDTVQFTFPQTINASAIGIHTISAWLVASGDTYLPNDSILDFKFRNQPLIAQFPYLQNFEQNDGNWFPSGIKSSWEYGKPVSMKINKAASGAKAWKTNLSGSYNDNETSYLTSPCFDIASLQNPTFSFSAAMDIENCGATICDAAWVEWSSDGILWTKLGASGEGFHWYGDDNVWDAQDDTRWKVATIPLPKISGSISLRFVFASDAGAAREGIAIDDIHVYDLQHPVYDNGSATTIISPAANAWSDATISNQLLASGFNLNEATEVTFYPHQSALHPNGKLYLLPLNFVLKGSGSKPFRFFVEDDKVVKMLLSNACPACEKAPDAYRLGLLQYNDASAGNENGSLLDNAQSGYQFSPSETIAWVPYGKGYYAESVVSLSSEIWFSTGIPEGNPQSISVFPNPIRDGQIHFTYVASPGSEMQIILSETSGKTVFKTSLTATDFDNVQTISIPDLATGVYVLRYEMNGERKEMKVVVSP